MRRASLNEKFGRSGDLNFDINLRGARDAIVQANYDLIAKEGHAVGRHGYRVTEGALDLRAMYKIDPMTGTRVDFYRAPELHSAGSTASKFTSREAIVNANRAILTSSEYANALAAAQSNGQTRFEVSIPLERGLGSNYLNDVYGKTRIGTASNPLGTGITDFTGGSIIGRYRLGSDGRWSLNTMYPSPRS